MRIIRRRGLIRLCCMLCSRMSVNRGRRLRRGDEVGFLEGSLKRGKDYHGQAYSEENVMTEIPGDCHGTSKSPACVISWAK